MNFKFKNLFLSLCLLLPGKFLPAQIPFPLTHQENRTVKEVEIDALNLHVYNNLKGNNLTEAENLAKEACTQAFVIGYTPGISDAFYLLHLIYFKKTNFQLSAFYLQKSLFYNHVDPDKQLKYATLHDSLNYNNALLQPYMQEINFLGNFDELERNDYRKKLSNTILLLFIVIFIITFLLIFISIINEKNVKSLNHIRQLNDDQNLYFSIIAHDVGGRMHMLRNVLTELTEQAKPENYDLKNGLNVGKNLFEKINNTFQNLLKMAVKEDPRIKPSYQKFPLKALYNKLTLLFLEARNKNIKLHFNYPENKLLNADEKMMATIITNLLANAIQHAEANSIEINMTFTKNEFYSEITDNGKGIANNVKENLFNIDHKPSDNYDGHGFGLFLCKKLVNAHGGQICVETKKQKGTKIWFTIPQ